MIRILCLAVALWGLCLSAARADGPITLILAHGARQNPFVIPAAALAWKFKESVEQASDRQIRVHIVPDSQAGQDSARLELLKKGVIHSTLVSAADFLPLYPAMAATLAPFAVDTRQQAIQLYSGSFGAAMLEDIQQTTGLRALALPAIDPLQVISSQRRPILSPDDAEGLPVAVAPETDLTPQLLEGLAATPTALPVRQIFQHLDSGQVDGFCGAADLLLALHLDEVQSFVSITQHRLAPMVWLFQPDSLAGLTEEQQKMIQNAVGQAVQSAQHLSQRLDQELVSSAKLARLLEVHSLTAEQRAAFQRQLAAATEQAVQAKAGDAGLQWLAKLRDGVKR